MLIDQRGVGLERFVILVADGILKLVNHLRTEEVPLPLAAPLVVPTHLESVGRGDTVGEGLLMTENRLHGDGFQIRSLNAGGRPGKVFVHHILPQPQAFKNLGSEVALYR